MTDGMHHLVADLALVLCTAALVTILFQRLHLPVILGYLHSSSKHQSPLPEDKGKEQFGFVTKSGIKLVFDDSNKRLTLAVPTGNGDRKKTIVVNDATGALELKDENKNSIKMNASGITIESSKIVTIKGAQVKIN